MPDINLNQKYKGILTLDSRKDCYHFTKTSDGPLYLTASSEDVGKLYFELYDSNGDTTILQTRPKDAKFDEIAATIANPLQTQQLQINLNKGGEWKWYNDFPAGDYTLYIEGKRDYSKEGKTDKDGESGIYSLKLSDKPDKAVTKLECEQSFLRFTSGAEAEPKNIVLAVSPTDASDTGVRIVSVEPEGLFQITNDPGENLAAGKTMYSVKPLAESGQATVTFETTGTDKNGKHLTATCQLMIADNIDNPNVVKGMKVDLTGPDYFPGHQAGDKYEFDPLDTDRGTGSISKAGVFTAKKAGKVSIVQRRKVDGKLVDTGEIATFFVEAPEYTKKVDPSAKKPKNLTTLNVTARTEAGVVDPIDVNEYIKCKTLMPVKYVSSEKVEKNFHVDEKTGEVTVLGSGTVKVTLLYEDNARTKAKGTFTIKSKLPLVSAGKSIKVSATAKKPATVKLKNAPKDMTAAPEWHIYGVGEDGKPNGVEAAEIATITEVVETTKSATNHMSCKIQGLTAGQKFAVVATITGKDHTGKDYSQDYWSIVEVKQ